MTFAVRTATGLKNVAAWKIRDASGTLKTVQKAYLRTAAGLKAIYGTLSVQLSSNSASGSINRAGTGTAATQFVQATPVGGVAPYTYLWTRTDGGAHAWTISNPAAAITNFSTTVGTNTEQTATFKCTVTDATGTAVDSGAVNADCWNDGGGL